MKLAQGVILLLILVGSAAVLTHGGWLPGQPDEHVSQNVWTGFVRTPDQKNATVHFHVYSPNRLIPGSKPVLILVGRLNSSGASLLSEPFLSFAEKHDMVVVAPTFASDMDGWNQQTSYQYPEAWSGKALNDILKVVGKNISIDRSRLYLFGYSAGAQFVHRYALLYSNSCRAVAAHAAGGYTWPVKKVPTSFFITAGNLDEIRFQRAKRFVEKANRLGIDARFQLMPNHDHRLSSIQINKSLAFFEDYL